jgi:hypothetical protein
MISPLKSSRRDVYGSVFPDEYPRNRVRDDLADQWRGHATAFLWVFEKNRRAVRFYERLGGEVREREVKPVFGHAMPSVKVVWSDLSVIIGHERGQGMFCHSEVPGQ